MKNKVNLQDCLGYIRDARAKGLTAPVILMGYLNPFLAYGLDKLMKEAQEAGACVFVESWRSCMIIAACVTLNNKYPGQAYEYIYVFFLLDAHSIYSSCRKILNCRKNETVYLLL